MPSNSPKTAAVSHWTSRRQQRMPSSPCPIRESAFPRNFCPMFLSGSNRRNGSKSESTAEWDSAFQLWKVWLDFMAEASAPNLQGSGVELPLKSHFHLLRLPPLKPKLSQIKENAQPLQRL